MSPQQLFKDTHSRDARCSLYLFIVVHRYMTFLLVISSYSKAWFWTAVHDTLSDKPTRCSPRNFRCIHTSFFRGSWTHIEIGRVSIKLRTECPAVNTTMTFTTNSQISPRTALLSRIYCVEDSLSDINRS